jgi:hypothetical protein
VENLQKVVENKSAQYEQLAQDMEKLTSMMQQNFSVRFISALLIA